MTSEAIAVAIAGSGDFRATGGVAGPVFRLASRRRKVGVSLRFISSGRELRSQTPDHFPPARPGSFRRSPAAKAAAAGVPDIVETTYNGC